jgi:hypothetical protein
MTDKYADDRKDPPHPACPGVRLLFDGAVLKLRVPGAPGKDKNDWVYSYAAVSGRKNDSGKFTYDVDRQKLKNIGPIPEGAYWVDPSEIWENAWYKSGSYASWGNFRVIIHPYPKTETWGRGGMFIHGGDVPGSAGCVDLTSLIDKFIGRLREYTGGFRACHVPMKVIYPNKPDGGGSGDP